MDFHPASIRGFADIPRIAARKLWRGLNANVAPPPLLCHLRVNRSFLVKGILPKYIPPKATESILDNRLDPQLSLQLSMTNQRNYMADNIKKSKASPPRLRVKEPSPENKTTKENLEEKNYSNTYTTKK